MDKWPNIEKKSKEKLEEISLENNIEENDKFEKAREKINEKKEEWSEEIISEEDVEREIKIMHPNEIKFDKLNTNWKKEILTFSAMEKVLDRAIEVELFDKKVMLSDGIGVGGPTLFDIVSLPKDIQESLLLGKGYEDYEGNLKDYLFDSLEKNRWNLDNNTAYSDEDFDYDDMSYHGDNYPERKSVEELEADLKRHVQNMPDDIDPEIKKMVKENHPEFFNREGEEKQVGNELEKKDENKSEESMKWAKDRALRLLDEGDLKQAIDSMVSDLNKTGLDGDGLAGMLGMAIRNKPDLTKEEVEDFIKGFN